MMINTNYSNQINTVDSRGLSPLLNACLTEDIGLVRHLLKMRANVNFTTDNGLTPLHVACEKNHFEIAKFLVLAGANVNACEAGIDSPLRTALETPDSKEIIELLITYGADVNKSDPEGNTPLHIACAKANIPAMKLLIKAGANVNAPDAIKATPLHIALMHDHSKPARLLLKSGADINAQAESSSGDLGMLPLDVLLQIKAEKTHEAGRKPLIKRAKILFRKGARSSRYSWSELIKILGMQPPVASLGG